MAGSALASAKVKVHRTPSDINEVRERSNGGEADQRVATNRSDTTVGRERAEAERMCDSLGGQRDWINHRASGIPKVQG